MNDRQLVTKVVAAFKAEWQRRWPEEGGHDGPDIAELDVLRVAVRKALKP